MPQRDDESLPSSPFLDRESFEWEAEPEPSRAVALETPFLHALEAGQPAVGEPELEEFSEELLLEAERGIIGRDDRVRVRRTLEAPCRWVCQISVQRWNSEGKRVHDGPAATGVLISPRHVLTAAHVLSGGKTDDRGQWIAEEARWVTVTPARNGKDEPLGSYTTQTWTTAPGWDPKARNRWQYDYALITLDKPIGNTEFKALGNRRLCWWGHPGCGERTRIARMDPAALEGRRVFTAGYPEDKGKTLLYSAAGRLHGVGLKGRERIMNLSTDARHGQSGSPVWVVEDGNRVLTGILTEAGDVANTAVRVTREFVRQLRRWLGSDWEQREAPSGEGEAFEEEAAETEAYEAQAYEEEFGEEEEGEVEEFEEERSFEREEPDAAELRKRMVARAQQELARWKNGALAESDPAGLAILEEYYKGCGVKVTGKDKLGNRKWHCRNAWSAVFISWLAKQSGAGKRFRYSRAHQGYIRAAKKNRVKKAAKQPFWAFKVTEVAPEVGDLVCMDRRCQECDDCSGATWANIDKSGRKCTHADIVTEVNSGKITVIGGNLRDSVRQREFKLGSDGKLDAKQIDCGFFAIVRAIDAPPAWIKEFEEEEESPAAGDEEEVEDEVEEEEEYDSGIMPGALAEVEEFFEEEALSGKGLVLLEHLHVNKTRDPATGALAAAAGPTVMQPANMNPGFIRPATDELILDDTATGLQGRLRDLVLTKYHRFLSPTGVRERRATAADTIRLALVDLTGGRLSNPDLAGWGSTVAMDGASVPKILPLYALFQLRFDLSELARSQSISRGADLTREAEKKWKAAGLKPAPNLRQLFRFRETSGNPVALDFQDWLGAARFSVNSNCHITRLMIALGFPFIGSVASQSGLRHASRGGLWLGTMYLCRAFPPRGWSGDPVPRVAGCGRGRSGHHVTALSAATYYTLLAQGRLVNDHISGEIFARLQRGCTLGPGGFLDGLAVLSGAARTAQKCGVLGGCLHESMLVERDRFRYVAVLLTKNARRFPFSELIQDLDGIIQDRNP